MAGCMGMERSGRVLGALWARSVFPTVPIWYLALGMGEYMKPDDLGSLVGIVTAWDHWLAWLTQGRDHWLAWLTRGLRQLAWFTQVGLSISICSSHDVWITAYQAAYMLLRPLHLARFLLLLHDHSSFP
jgi:hypothetical protein